MYNFYDINQYIMYCNIEGTQSHIDMKLGVKSEITKF